MKLRIVQIVKLLLKSRDILTVSEIANTLNVSNKTIRNDLKIVEHFFDDKQLILIKKTGVGIYIEGNEKDKLSMLSEIKSYDQVEHQSTSNDRQLYMLNQLLNNPKKTTISTLEEELFISRPSVYKDLEKVKDWLAVREIEIIKDSKKGLVLKAGEKRIRKGIFDLMLLSGDSDQIIDILESDDGAINYFSYDQKNDLISVDYDVVKNILSESEDKFEIHFTAKGLSRLTTKYCIAISRMIDGHFVDMKKNTQSELKNLDQYKTMRLVADEISDEFDVNISDEEVCYLFGITIGTKTHFDQMDWNLNHDMLVINKIIANEVIEQAKQVFNLIDDQVLFNGLVHHLKSVTNKIKYGLDFHNPMVDDIRIAYPISFKIALKARSIFEDYYNFQIPLEEVGYLAVHIASALERSKQPLKTCILYSTSYSEIKLMIEILKNNFNQLRIEKVIPVSMLDTINKESIDLFISTEELNSTNKDITVVLPTVLINNDMVKFGELLSRIYEKHNDKILKNVKKEKLL